MGEGRPVRPGAGFSDRLAVGHCSEYSPKPAAGRPPRDRGLSAAEELLRKERTQRLLLAVRRMSEIDCSLFYRKYYYLQSAAQMAAELGLTERGVEGRLRRIRLRLRKELRGEWNV